MRRAAERPGAIAAERPRAILSTADRPPETAARPEGGGTGRRGGMGAAAPGGSLEAATPRRGKRNVLCAARLRERLSPSFPPCTTRTHAYSRVFWFPGRGWMGGYWGEGRGRAEVWPYSAKLPHTSGTPLSLRVLTRMQAAQCGRAAMSVPGAAPGTRIAAVWEGVNKATAGAAGQGAGIRRLPAPATDANSRGPVPAGEGGRPPRRGARCERSEAERSPLPRGFGDDAATLLTRAGFQAAFVASGRRSRPAFPCRPINAIGRIIMHDGGFRSSRGFGEQSAALELSCVSSAVQLFGRGVSLVKSRPVEVVLPDPHREIVPADEVRGVRPEPMPRLLGLNESPKARCPHAPNLQRFARRR